MGLVVGFGSKNVRKYDPIAPTVGLGSSNRFSYGLSIVRMIYPRKEVIPKDEG